MGIHPECLNYCGVQTAQLGRDCVVGDGSHPYRAIETPFPPKDIATLAAVRRSDEQLARLESIDLSTRGKVVTEKLCDQFVHKNAEFHILIGEMSHNRELSSLCRALHERFIRVSYLQFRNLYQQVTVSCHASIIEALRNRDADAARRAMIDDILSGQAKLMSTLQPLSQ